jgi:hypothetical protein
MITKNAIIVIGTGRYFLLALRLIHKINMSYKCDESSITFHLFSDQKPKNKINNLILHEVSSMGWTDSTLYRFTAAKKIIDFGYDNIAYIDADTKFIKDSLCHKDIFYADIFGVEHPWQDFAKRESFEERIESSAFIDPALRKIYYQASFFGGSLENFAKLINDASERLQKDLNNNILAKYDDESYVQPFLNYNNVVVFDITDRIVLGEKGLGKNRDFLHGRHIDMNQEWSDEEYSQMIKDASDAIEKNLVWDIQNKKIVIL